MPLSLDDNNSWLESPDGDDFFWCCNLDMQWLFFIAVLDGKYAYTHEIGDDFRTMGNSRHWNRGNWPHPNTRYRRLDKVVMPQKPVDITRWHHGGPCKPGQWWCRNPRMKEDSNLRTYTQDELDSVKGPWNSDMQWAYAGPIPALPEE